MNEDQEELVCWYSHMRGGWIITNRSVSAVVDGPYKTEQQAQLACQVRGVQIVASPWSRKE